MADTEMPDELDPTINSARKEAREDRDEIERLKDALHKIASGTTDRMPPFRAISRDMMQTIARTALRY